MAKKKKTRKQKALSDLRHKAITPKRDISSSQERLQEDENPQSSIFSYTMQAAKTSPAYAAKSAPVTEYHYIAHDLTKTAALTTAIVLVQLALYIVINNLS